MVATWTCIPRRLVMASRIFARFPNALTRNSSFKAPWSMFIKSTRPSTSFSKMGVFFYPNENLVSRACQGVAMLSFCLNRFWKSLPMKRRSVSSERAKDALNHSLTSLISQSRGLLALVVGMEGWGGMEANVKQSGLTKKKHKE